jgi:hypothetical protein
MEANTILNTSYKILAKALALCLKHILPKIVRTEKTSFINGQYILDNVITVWEGMVQVCALDLDALHED